MTAPDSNPLPPRLIHRAFHIHVLIMINNKLSSWVRSNLAELVLIALEQTFPPFMIDGRLEITTAWELHLHIRLPHAVFRHMETIYMKV
jgi:hypothetical protein